MEIVFHKMTVGLNEENPHGVFENQWWASVKEQQPGIILFIEFVPFVVDIPHCQNGLLFAIPATILEETAWVDPCT
jgi:hypothetical protein